MRPNAVTTWARVFDFGAGDAAAQSRSPGTPKASYNVVRFTPVGTQRIRVQMAHASGFKTALTEAKVYNRGGGTDPGPTTNLALTATPSASYTSAWESVTALNDGIDPPSSNDTVNPRWERGRTPGSSGVN